MEMMSNTEKYSNLTEIKGGPVTPVALVAPGLPRPSRLTPAARVGHPAPEDAPASQVGHSAPEDAPALVPAPSPAPPTPVLAPALESAPASAPSPAPAPAPIEPNPLRTMFATQLSLLHALPSWEALNRGFGRADLVRCVGETWFIDPAYGEGTYWFYLSGGDTVVVSMDVTFTRHAEALLDTEDCLCFGLYEHAMPRYCSPECAGSSCKLMGLDWKGGPFCSSFSAGDRLSSASITIAPESVHRYARELGCDPARLRSAIGRLTESEGVPGLPSALRGLDIARPSAQVADAYYRAKVIECLTLLVSGVGGAGRSGPATEAVRVSDRACVECICSYIDGNLSADLGTKALAGIAHVSTGKLISAFRNVKGITPQGYIRTRRLEHGRRLLLEGDGGIKEIARAAGYGNQGAFCDAFKRAYGMTPRAYRKSLLARPDAT